jgi:hypothetical protein
VAASIQQKKFDIAALATLAPLSESPSYDNANVASDTNLTNLLDDVDWQDILVNSKKVMKLFVQFKLIIGMLLYNFTPFIYLYK